MIRVTRDEAFMLREKGRRNDVHVHSSTHYKSYYVTESAKTVQVLAEYRQAHIHPVHQ